MLTVGSFIRVTQDTLGEEPLVAGMVGRVIADLYDRTDPARQALVVIGGARKPCAVPLQAVEVISESDYGEELPESRTLWRQRRGLWRERHREAAPRGTTGEEGPRLDVEELVGRAQAVGASEVEALGSAAFLSLLSEWAVGALDALADELPRFGRLSYARVRQVRGLHIDRWLWSGVRVYLAVRSFHPALPPVAAEPGRERVRSLFDRVDTGDVSGRLSRFCLDVGAVKHVLTLMSSHWLDQATADFAKSIDPGSPVFEQLAQHILQLHIVGFQAAFAADACHHGVAH